MPQGRVGRWLDSLGNGSLLGRVVARLAGGQAAPEQALTHPKVVLLMRHGEKRGKKADIHLSARGAERANALPRLFPGTFPSPDYIFATKATASSNRPVETVTPLAKALGLAVESPYANDEFDELAHDLLHDPKYDGKTILICWHHGKIPGLTSDLGVAGPLPEWTQQQFDRVWRIEYTADGATLANLAQRLLAGDSAL